MATIDTQAQGPGGLTVALAAEAAELARRRGVGHISVSVSRHRGHAAAVAVTEAL
jgi:phosphopantetheinyl transferase (holo-ACP synthase)